MKYRKILIVLFAIILVVWLLLVFKANKKWELKEPLIFSKGETVEYGKDYYNSIEENRDGYFAVLKDAKILTMEDFLKSQNLTENVFGSSSFIPKKVYLVEMEFHNADNTTGGINLVNMRLSCKSCVLEISKELWSVMHPELSGSLGFSLRENSSKTLLLPYVFVDSAYETSRYDNLEWSLNLSQYPQKKIIAFNF